MITGVVLFDTLDFLIHFTIESMSEHDWSMIQVLLFKHKIGMKYDSYFMTVMNETHTVSNLYLDLIIRASKPDLSDA